jgi:mono/diheme cytochrome c family protein
VPAYQAPDFVQVKQTASADVITHGSQLFADNCASCHGQGANARAAFPDLRRSQLITDQAAFDSVVLEGARAERGMGSFKNRLQPADTQAVRAFLISAAEVARNTPTSPGTTPLPVSIHQEDSRGSGAASSRTSK